MDFPITVNAIEWGENNDPIEPYAFGRKVGSWVAVRPVSDDKTYLGVLIGSYALPSLSFKRDTGTLVVGKSMSNPAMWVPDLNRVIMGWGSWWSTIKSEADMRQISNQDIENVWYVKALKELANEMQADHPVDD